MRMPDSKRRSLVGPTVGTPKCGSARGRARCARKHPAKIEAGRILENAQIELGESRQEVIEDVRLDVFVVRPDLIVRERVDFYGQSGGGRLPVTHEQGHPVVDLGVVTQVGLDVLAERPEISTWSEAVLN